MNQVNEGGTETAAPAHCASYYAATANDGARYPALRGDHRTDVCVIGAGFTGLSTALTLAERGYAVTVLEARRVGWGASGRNGGQLIGGIGGEERLAAIGGEALAWQMRWRGHEIIRERVAAYGIDCDLRWGYVDVALKARHLAAFEADFARLQGHGFAPEHRLLDQAETAELLGTRAYLGGLLNMGNGHLHPLNLCLGEARAAVRRGVRLHEETEVIRIEPGPGGPAVVTTKGRVRADAVVLAGNAYHALERRRLSGLCFPAGSFIIATAPLPGPLRQRINRLGLAVCDPNYLLDYYRLSADGRMLFGGRVNFSGREPASIAAALRPRLLRLYPELATVPIEYEWGGKVAVVLNRVPLIGRAGPGVYFAQGYTGHGVNVTHLAGEIIADAIGGTLERLDVFERVRHWRLPLGQAASERLVALGLLWYRLRDLL